ncbi:MAG: cell-wall [Armatimonadetes bacterium]|nr:cell-wall [Armatimonadota bacterium]
MTEAAAQALAYFTAEAALRRPPASEESIAAAEGRLGTSFPPSLRAFLQVHNGLRLPQDELVLGVPPAGELAGLDLVGYTLLLREHGDADHLLALTANGTGDGWVLLLDHRSKRGECPVGWLDHETGEILCGASSYDHFLWFHLDRQQRFFEPDGTPKRAFYQYVGMLPDDWEGDEDPDWMDEEPYLPWPYADLRWMIHHDPRLAKFRSDQAQS